MAPRRLHITPGHLMRAWQQLAPNHPHWPTTFAACAAQPFAARLLRCEAVRLALADQARHARATPSTTSTTTTSTTPHNTAGHTPRQRPLQHCSSTRVLPAHLDRKRAAAGDTQDD